MSEPIVRGPDGQIHDLAWLRQTYGAGIMFHQAAAPHRFALREVNVMTSGETILRVWVVDAAGRPAIGQPVTYSFPTLQDPSQDLAAIPNAYCSRWAPRGVLNKNRADGSGRVEFEIGSNSWIRGGRGPYAVWVLSPSIESDCLDGIGWQMATEHHGPCELVFEEINASGAPDGGEDETPAPEPSSSPDLVSALDRLTATLRQIYHLEPAP